MGRLVFFSVLLLLAQISTAQDTSVRLDQDPIFGAVLNRHLAYPLKAPPGAYAKIYAGFSITKKGRVQNVTLLNPAKIGYGFEEEVALSLKRMPVLNPRYEGDYVLPVLFVWVNYDDHAKETAPDGTLPAWYFGNRTLLSEVRRENNQPRRERSTKYMRLRNLHPTGINNY